MLFEWSTKYELGIPILDEQHQGLVQLVNNLEQILTKKSRGQYSSIFSRLVRYTRYHFTTEEALMLASGFEIENINLHIRQHKQFIEELDAVCDDHTLITDTDLAVILDFLRNWLTNHICKVDKKLANHISKNEAFKASLLRRSSSSEAIHEPEIDYKNLMFYFHGQLREAEATIKKAMLKEEGIEAALLEIEQALDSIALVRKGIGRLGLSK